MYHPYTYVETVEKVDTNRTMNCVCSLSISGPDSFTSPNITNKAPLILEDFWARLTLVDFTDKEVHWILENFWAGCTFTAARTDFFG